MFRLLILLVSIILACSIVQARPTVQIMYAAKLIRYIEPNYFYVENLYTHKREYVIVAGTYFPPNSSQALKDEGARIVFGHYVDAPTPFMTIIKYGRDRYGRVVAEIKGMDHCSNLSHALIASGVCYWYHYFDRGDDFAYQMQKWARYHKSGVWKK